MAKKLAKPKAKKETPLMKQYNAIKAKYPDAVLLFRVGDFYETFGKDAIHASQILGITLTKRANGAASHIELAGFPHHSLDTYLPKLIKAGQRVAICDQLEEPQKGKKIVRRGVTELVTPGIALSDKILDHKANNFLASIHFGKQSLGVAFIDVSTGEFVVTEGTADYIDRLLQNFKPSEIIYCRNQKNNFNQYFGQQWYTYHLDEWIYQYDYAYESLCKHFQTNSLKGFGVDALQQGIVAAGTILQYLGDTEHHQLQHINNITRIGLDDYVWLDKFTIRNLELVNSPYENGKTLLSVLDRTESPMGARMMRQWLLLPLKSVQKINNRLQAVHYFMQHDDESDTLSALIKSIGDLERLIAKIPLKRIGPRQVASLKTALQASNEIKAIGEALGNDSLKQICQRLNNCNKAISLIESSLVSEPPVVLHKSPTIADGVNERLDQLRSIANNSKAHLEAIKTREVEATGITSLKIGFNNVFGYYLEVTNRFKDVVPEEWIRKQTLTSAERYITPELKELEQQILTAETEIKSIEERLYDQLLDKLTVFVLPIQQNARIIARLDCLLSFAKISIRNNYARPLVTDDYIIDIKGGRHPVIEQHMPQGESYIPNDVFLDTDNQQIIIITGPNMAGKSALLRQTALNCLMAQMGCFVPATSATLGVIDKVFTRVGASDNLSVGESTFMVEMNETASIMNNLSNRSLVLLDEIGRGTSTYDGISIAWALTEYLHLADSLRPKTLFATHYHELNELAEKYERIKNYHVSTLEQDNKVIFLRKLKEGGSHHSFGIHVAKMAGMPNWIIERANNILAELEQKSIDDDTSSKVKGISTQQYQLNLFAATDPELAKIKERLEKIDTNRLTPIEALIILSELKGQLSD